jgi:hypothetical protein
MKKPPKLSKLALRTETVRALDQVELAAAAGGAPTTTVWSHKVGCA